MSVTGPQTFETHSCGVENSRTIGRGVQRLVNQPFGTSEIQTVIGERVTQRVHEYRVIRTDP